MLSLNLKCNVYSIQKFHDLFVWFCFLILFCIEDERSYSCILLALEVVGVAVEEVAEVVLVEDHSEGGVVEDLVAKKTS